MKIRFYDFPVDTTGRNCYEWTYLQDSMNRYLVGAVDVPKFCPPEEFTITIPTSQVGTYARIDTDAMTLFYFVENLREVDGGECDVTLRADWLQTLFPETQTYAVGSYLTRSNAVGVSGVYDGTRGAFKEVSELLPENFTWAILMQFATKVPKPLWSDGAYAYESLAYKDIPTWRDAVRTAYYLMNATAYSYREGNATPKKEISPTNIYIVPSSVLYDFRGEDATLYIDDGGIEKTEPVKRFDDLQPSITVAWGVPLPALDFGNYAYEVGTKTNRVALKQDSTNTPPGVVIRFSLGPAAAFSAVLEADGAVIDITDDFAVPFIISDLVTISRETTSARVNAVTRGVAGISGIIGGGVTGQIGAFVSGAATLAGAISDAIQGLYGTSFPTLQGSGNFLVSTVETSPVNYPKNILTAPCFLYTYHLTQAARGDNARKGAATWYGLTDGNLPALKATATYYEGEVTLSIPSGGEPGSQNRQLVMANANRLAEYFRQGFTVWQSGWFS